MAIRILFSLLLSFCLCALSAPGYTATTDETSQYMKIPITQWQMLKEESAALSNELTAYKTELTRLKKPSAELLSQLEIAEKMLLQLQAELKEQKNDLTLLSSDKEKLKTSLETLKLQIDRERRIHKRQVWQNRFWCILIGAGIGVAASR